MTLLEGNVDLRPGEEWHSAALNLCAGEKVTISAVSQGGMFYYGFLSESDFIASATPGAPRWYLPLVKWSSRRKVRKIHTTEAHRMLLRLGSSQSPAHIHVTITLQPRKYKKQPAEPPTPVLGTEGGVKSGPFDAWDAVESMVVWTLIAVGLMVMAIVNADVVRLQPAVIAQGGPLLISLFQADAEWCIFLAGLYVAAKALPAIFRKRRESDSAIAPRP